MIVNATERREALPEHPRGQDPMDFLGSQPHYVRIISSYGLIFRTFEGPSVDDVDDASQILGIGEFDHQGSLGVLTR